ncbi:MAG: hypothetical protein IKN70_02590 [Fibrobacter sp.]|nr:hypothetical protein [Fibrobacter sp.]
MNRISLCAMSAAVVMTACTDYRAQINEAHDDYVKEHNPSSLPFYSGCSCDVLQYNMLRVGPSEYKFVNPTDASSAENHTIRYILSGCNEDVSYVTNNNPNPDFVRETKVSSQGSGTYWIDNDLYPEMLGTSRADAIASTVNVSNEVGSVDAVTCPTVYLNAIETPAPSTQTSSTTTTPATSRSPYYCGDLWCGPEDMQGKVETGSDAETAGYWFQYTDANYNGTSSFFYPPEVSVDEWDNFYGPLIQAYGGIKGHVEIGPGYDYPYAGLGFNLVSDNQEGMNISWWGGVCIVYQSTIGFEVELVPENEAVVTEYNNYLASVLKSASMKVLDIPWSKFKQGSGWGQIVSQDEILASVAGINIKFSGTAGTAGDFLIQSIGRSGSCVQH